MSYGLARAYLIYAPVSNTTVTANTFAKLVRPADLSPLPSYVADNDWVDPAGSSDPVHGVFADTVTALSGNQATRVLVAVGGIVPVTVSPGKSISIRDPVSPDSSGNAQTWSPGQFVAGIALTSSRSATSTVDVLLTPSNIAVATSTAGLTYGTGTTQPSWSAGFSSGATVTKTGGSLIGGVTLAGSGSVSGGAAAATATFPATVSFATTPTFVSITPASQAAVLAGGYIGALSSSGFAIYVANTTSNTTLSWYFSVEA